jgi:hypothetical protein
MDSATVSLSGRMAQLVDIYSVKESGIQTLDLTADLTDFKIATIYETSNADLGYTVTVTSTNLANDSVGHTTAYFKHETGSSTISYDLAYGGTAVAVWTAGSAEVTNSNAQTASSGDSRDVTISYTGNATLASGSYWDTLTFTIAAK